jgi:hypothetical protein
MESINAAEQIAADGHVKLSRMNRRRDIQQHHERAVVSDFLAWFERRRKVAFCVVYEPNPPEAIIRSKRLTRWVEVVDAFWSKDWARDQYSYATPGERHVPLHSGPYAEPDLNFATSFVEDLSRKLEKTTYQPFAEKYGPGYLVVNIDYPLFDRHAHLKAKELWAKGQPWPNCGYFREVFLRIRMFRGYAFQTWAVQRDS